MHPYTSVSTWTRLGHGLFQLWGCSVGSSCSITWTLVFVWAVTACLGLEHISVAVEQGENRIMLLGMEVQLPHYSNKLRFAGTRPPHKVCAYQSGRQVISDLGVHDSYLLELVMSFWKKHYQCHRTLLIPCCSSVAGFVSLLILCKLQQIVSWMFSGSERHSVT